MPQVTGSKTHRELLSLDRSWSLSGADWTPHHARHHVPIPLGGSIPKDHISVKNMIFSNLLSSPLALSSTETQSLHDDVRKNCFLLSSGHSPLVPRPPPGVSNTASSVQHTAFLSSRVPCPWPLHSCIPCLKPSLRTHHMHPRPCRISAAACHPRHELTFTTVFLILLLTLPNSPSLHSPEAATPSLIIPAWPLSLWGGHALLDGSDRPCPSSLSCGGLWCAPLHTMSLLRQWHPGPLEPLWSRHRGSETEMKAEAGTQTRAAGKLGTRRYDHPAGVTC